jgi:hypothetical protein
MQRRLARIRSILQSSPTRFFLQREACVCLEAVGRPLSINHRASGPAAAFRAISALQFLTPRCGTLDICRAQSASFGPICHAGLRRLSTVSSPALASANPIGALFLARNLRRIPVVIGISVEGLPTMPELIVLIWVASAVHRKFYRRPWWNKELGIRISWVRMSAPGP